MVLSMKCYFITAPVISRGKIYNDVKEKHYQYILQLPLQIFAYKAPLQQLDQYNCVLKTFRLNIFGIFSTAYIINLIRWIFSKIGYVNTAPLLYNSDSNVEKKHWVFFATRALIKQRPPPPQEEVPQVNSVRL